MKRVWSVLVPLAVFFVVSAVGFAPQFDGKVLPQHDLVQYEGMRSDIVETREAIGEDPHWTGRMFGGMPAYLIDVAYPSQIVKNTVGQVSKLVPTPAGFLFFAMTAFWVMLLMMGVNPWVGTVSALAYGLSTYFFLIIGAGHATKMWALVYAPLMVGGVWMTLRARKKQKMWLGAALTALFASLEIGANHPQITYYFLLVILALWISEGVRSKWASFGKRTLILLAAGIIAVGSNFAPLYYTMRHSHETVRESGAGGGLDLDYATAWSYGRTESWTMLVPNLMGGDSGQGLDPEGQTAKALRTFGYPARAAAQTAAQFPAYWGTQPYTAGPTYLGAAVIFLAVLALFVVRRREWLWIVSVSIFALLLAWGSHLMGFTELAFKILPGYNKFRTVSMALVILQFTVPLLTAWALAALCRGKIATPKLKQSLYLSTGIVGGLCLVFALFGDSIFGFGRAALFEAIGNDTLVDAIVADRWKILQPDAWRSLLMVALAAACVWVYALKKLPRQWLVGLLAVVVVVDLLPVGLRFQPHDRFVAPRHAEIKPTPADLQILQDPDPSYRVLNLSVSPFNDATTSYFHRSVGGYHGAKLANYQYVIDHYLTQDGPEREEMLDRLNVRYVIHSRDSVEIRHIDTSHQPCLVEYLPHYQRYEHTAEAPETVSFSEIYYPDGWKAYIDGEETPYVCADHIFRAIENFPAGTHTVEWRFASPHWRAVNAVTLICSLLILLSVIYCLYEERKKS